MKVLFVYPGIANIGFNAFYDREDSVDSWYIPIGICYLASSILKDGHEVDLMDLRYLSGFEDVEKKLASSDCDAVAISFQTPSSKYAYEVAKIARSYGKVTIGGGIHPTVLPRELIDSSFFNYVVVGEGNISFPKLINDLQKGIKSTPIITGEHVKILDEIPFPHYFDLYVDSVIKEQKLSLIFTSRGCPGRCNFCQPVARNMFGKKVIFRSADNIIEELRECREKYGTNHFMLVDDTFLVKRKLVKEFCRKLIDSNMGLTWTCNARVNEFEEEMARLMAESGCNWICIGFESGSQKILDMTKKGTTVEQGYRAAELCYKYGIGFTTNILVGVPGETEEDYKLNLEFVKNINSSTISYNCLVPYPGTEIYDYCKENDLLIKDLSWDGYEMNKIQENGIISSVDYNMVRRWAEKIVCWNGGFNKIVKEGNDFEINGELEKALEKYLLLIKEYPESYFGYFHAGKAYKSKGEYDFAENNLRKALSILDNQNDRLTKIRAHFHLGELFYNSDKKKLAKLEFENCIELDPKHKKADNYLKQLGNL